MPVFTFPNDWLVALFAVLVTDVVLVPVGTVVVITNAEAVPELPPLSMHFTYQLCVPDVRLMLYTVLSELSDTEVSAVTSAGLLSTYSVQLPELWSISLLM